MKVKLLFEQTKELERECGLNDADVKITTFSYSIIRFLTNLASTENVYVQKYGTKKLSFFTCVNIL